MESSFALDLADRFNTPLYAYDLGHVEQQTQALRAALPESARLFHSFKANPLPAIAEQIRLGGAQAEITSEGELIAARFAGHDLSTALFGGPGKTVKGLQAALTAGVRWFSCESFVELQRLSDVARSASKEVNVLLRVNPAEPPDARLVMTGVASQFGFDEDLLLGSDAARHIHLPGLHLSGVHIYFGTQMASAAAIFENTRRALETATRLEESLGFECKVVNAGGGFPWPYANAASPPDLQGLHDSLTALWLASPFHSRAELWFEAGRFLCAGSGILLTRVLDVKVSRNRTFIVLDTGIHHLGGMAGLGRLPRSAVTFQNHTCIRDEEITADIVGPLCTPLDSLCRGVKLPRVEAGDLLAIPNVGAYGLTASLTGFLSHPPPLELSYRQGAVTQAWRWSTGHQPLSSLEFPH